MEWMFFEEKKFNENCKFYFQTDREILEGE